jgi:glutathione synthase/RimK-type ligase-like ATP-grasp enzyme
LQKYIDSGEPKTDLRVYVVDGKVSAAYKRFALDKDFRSNYSLSHQGEKVKLTDEEIQMAIDAASAVNLGVCAVDIIRDSNDNEKPYCIEINGNGNLQGIQKVTGHNVALDIVLYAEKIGKNGKKSESKLPEGNKNIKPDAKGGETEEEGFFSRFNRLSNGG